MSILMTLSDLERQDRMILFKSNRWNVPLNFVVVSAVSVALLC